MRTIGQRRTVLVAVAIAAVVLFHAPVVRAEKLPVPYYWQSGANWCWAASASMMGKYYNRTPVGGTQIKPWWGAHFRGKGYSDSGGWSDYVTILAAVDPARAYEQVDIGDESGTKSFIVQKLDQGHPVIFRSMDNALGPHGFLVTGYDGTNDATGKVYVNDPSGALFKDTNENSYCAVEMTWASFFDVIDTTPDPDGYIISATSPTGLASGAQISMDLCPARSSLIPGSTSAGVYSRTDGANYLELEWDGATHPGYYYLRTGSAHAPAVGGRNYEWKFGSGDTVEVFSCITCYSTNGMDIRVDVDFKCVGESIYSTSGTFTANSRSHTNRQVAAIPIGTIVAALSQEECEIAVVLSSRTNGTGDSFVEDDRVTAGCRVELLAGHTVSWPDAPAGRSFGRTNEVLTFTSGNGSCSDGHGVAYMFGWGDGTYSDWSTNVQSAQSWETTGVYHVDALARCTNDVGITSSWSVATAVTIGEIPVHYAAGDGAHVWPYTNWHDAAADVQSAVNAALDGEGVSISGGTYYVASDISINRAITVHGVDGREVTVIHGSNATRCFALYDPDAVVESITATGGNEPDGLGGGIYCYHGGLAKNCLIIGNTARWGGGVCLRNDGQIAGSMVSENTAGDSGGGIYCYESGAISNCVIYSNSAGWGGGVFFDDAGTAVDCEVARNTGTNSGGGVYGSRGGIADNCHITSNSALFGGGVYLAYGGSVIRNSTISSNYGSTVAGGARIYEGGLIENCFVNANMAPSGGGVYVLSTGTVRNCIARGNYASGYGGAIYCSQGGIIENCLALDNVASNNRAGGIYCFEGGTVQNCTVVSNYSNYGGGIYCRNGGAVVNTIMYYNSSPHSPVNWYANGTNISYSYSCTTPAVGGVSNITGNPAFRDVGSDDFRLSTGSPCIDSASAAGTPSCPDLAGVPRPLDGDGNALAAADRGAYEFIDSSADTDGDRMPDWWEIDWSLDATNPADAAWDPDADSFSNLQEWIAGTVPTCATSLLTVAAAEYVTNGWFILRWASVSGRIYSVEWATNLVGTDPFQPLVTNLPASPAENTYSDQVHDTERQVFYRIGVDLEP